jgi:crotonobetainyl-CoA:carnitine CoA-transferase CaiB-like acyl-CoA transferase
MTHLWSYEDADAPPGSQSIFPDHFAGRAGAVGALAGVLGRRRHGGRGYHVEVCQVEQVVNVMGDLLAKESLEPGSVHPRGNHSDRGTPWGLYPTAGDDEWVAICTRNDAEWAALATVMGSPDWTADPDLSALEGRRAREAEIDRRVGEWTATLDRREVTDRCIAGGVPAGPMLTASGQVNDPHFQARGFLQERFQPPIGNMTFEGAGFHATGMIGPDIRPAPGLGEHTREVAAELGLAPEETEALIAEGVLETDPPHEG